LILQNKTLLTVEKKYIKEEGPTLGKTNKTYSINIMAEKTTIFSLKFQIICFLCSLLFQYSTFYHELHLFTSWSFDVKRGEITFQLLKRMILM
jgi:hypothetical protein